VVLTLKMSSPTPVTVEPTQTQDEKQNINMNEPVAGSNAPPQSGTDLHSNPQGTLKRKYVPDTEESSRSCVVVAHSEEAPSEEQTVPTPLRQTHEELSAQQRHRYILNYTPTVKLHVPEKGKAATFSNNKPLVISFEQTSNGTSPATGPSFITPPMYVPQDGYITPERVIDNPRKTAHFGMKSMNPSIDIWTSPNTTIKIGSQLKQKLRLSNASWAKENESNKAGTCPYASRFFQLYFEIENQLLDLLVSDPSLLGVHHEAIRTTYKASNSPLSFNEFAFEQVVRFHFKSVFPARWGQWMKLEETKEPILDAYQASTSMIHTWYIDNRLVTDTASWSNPPQDNQQNNERMLRKISTPRCHKIIQTILGFPTNAPTNNRLTLMPFRLSGDMTTEGGGLPLSSPVYKCPAGSVIIAPVTFAIRKIPGEHNVPVSFKVQINTPQFMHFDSATNPKFYFHTFVKNPATRFR
jgi:hypothetical protein